MLIFSRIIVPARCAVQHPFGGLRRLRLLGSRDEQNFTLGETIVERHTYLHKDESAQ